MSRSERSAQVSSSMPDVTAETTADLSEPAIADCGDRVHGVLVALSGPQGGAIFILDKDEITLGRSRDNHIWLVDEGISRLHARVVRGPDGFYIEDAGSTNGTSCQGEALRGPRKLEDGDRVSIGRDTLLRFGLQDEIERHAAKQTLELQLRDPVTRLLNRRHFDRCVQAEVAFSRRHGTTLALLMFDIDHFKSVNDTHGHAAGDAVLRAVAETLDGAVRVEDTVCRYGGEEFAVLVRGIEASGVRTFAERMRALVAEVRVPLRATEIKVTTSIGVTMLTRAHRSVEHFLADADRALYAAKDRGRDTVVIG
jgi:diguanylate cyclase (GGDEF)-like protein